MFIFCFVTFDTALIKLLGDSELSMVLLGKLSGIIMWKEVYIILEFRC